MPMYRALIVPWSEISLVSIQDKIHKGWKWLGQDNTIQLTDQDNVRHTFKLQDDMYRYHGTDSDATYACRFHHSACESAMFVCACVHVYVCVMR